MKSLLIETIEAVGYKNLVYLQGSMNPDEAYPDKFVTILTIGSPDAAHFDNVSVGTAWKYQVINYANDPLVVAEDAKKIRIALKAAGFIPQGKGRDIPSDEPTHTGWVTDYYFLEMEE